MARTVEATATSMTALCKICRRRRPLMPNSRVCFPCSIGPPHRCPECHLGVIGGGQALCDWCSRERRSRYHIDREAETIPRRWLVNLFVAFCLSGEIPLRAVAARLQIERAADACRRIAITAPNPADLSTETVHASLGTDGMRRVAPLIAYMVKVGALDRDRAQLRTLSGAERIAAIIDVHKDGHHAALLQRYREHLVSLGRKPITQRTALTAATALLALLGDAPLADLSKRHLTRHLRKSPGDRATLQGFLSFVADQGGPILASPELRSPSAAAQERQRQAEIKAWQKRLRSPRSGGEGRAMLILLLARIYDLPTPRILTLRRNQVSVTRASVTLWPETDARMLHEPLAAAFRRWGEHSSGWTAAPGPWVFPGRNPDRPLTEASLKRYINR